MKKVLLTLASIVMLASCGQKTADPVKEAITAEIGKTMGVEAPKVTFATLEKIDSTTYGQELERRIDVFETKCKVMEKYVVKYTSEGKVNNAQLKREEWIKATQNLNALKAHAETLTDILDKVAYYDYAFSAKASGGDKKMEFKEAYATITPDNQVLGLCANKKDIHKGMGKVIPGYLDIFKGEAEEE